MLIPDVNILVYAYDADSTQYGLAREWWEQSLNGPRPVGIPWASLLGFMRVSTSRRILTNPLRVGDAIRHVRAWLDRPNVQILNPGASHAEILFGLLGSVGMAGNLTTDAHLAALAIEFQAELVSTDVDFARFPGLRWFNPLAIRR